MLGGEIIANPEKYKDVIFFKLGTVDKAFQLLMFSYMSQQSDLEEISNMYATSKKKYPSSWWVEQLEPIFEGITPRYNFLALNEFIQNSIVKEIDRFESESHKMLTRVTRPEALFSELRNWAKGLEFKV